MTLFSNAGRDAVLAKAGLHPRPQEYDLAKLARLARARGWGWGWATTPATTHQGRPGRWRASVFVPARADAIRHPYALGSRGAGRTEAEALARALATALAREG